MRGGERSLREDSLVVEGGFLGEPSMLLLRLGLDWLNVGEAVRCGGGVPLRSGGGMLIEERIDRLLPELGSRGGCC